MGSGTTAENAGDVPRAAAPHGIVVVSIIRSLPARQLFSPAYDSKIYQLTRFFLEAFRDASTTYSRAGLTPSASLQVVNSGSESRRDTCSPGRPTLAVIF